MCSSRCTLCLSSSMTRCLIWSRKSVRKGKFLAAKIVTFQRYCQKLAQRSKRSLRVVKNKLMTCVFSSATNKRITAVNWPKCSSLRTTIYAPSQ